MELVRWKDRNELAPWNALRELETRMSRLFDEPGWDWPQGAWTPTADLRETGDGYIVEMDVPGMSRDDLELTVLDNVLSIKGERKQSEELKEEGVHRVERRYGTFQRSFEIPGGFDSEHVKADYKDGVLTVHLPKRPETKPRHIDVQMN
jgi:HSP20 family protein